MAVDFTTFTEVDPNNKLTVISAKITAVDLDRDEDAYVYRDYGANAFNGFSINFEWRIESTSVNTGAAIVGMTQATVDDSSGWGINDFGISLTRQDPNFNITLFEGDNSESDTIVGVGADAIVYMTISRTEGGTSLYVAAFSDSGRTSQIGATISIAISSATKFRYVYGISSLNNASGGRNFDGFVQNMTINAIVFPTPGVATAVGNPLVAAVTIALKGLLRDLRLVAPARKLSLKSRRRDTHLSSDRRKK